MGPCEGVGGIYPKAFSDRWTGGHGTLETFKMRKHAIRIHASLECQSLWRDSQAPKVDVGHGHGVCDGHARKDDDEGHAHPDTSPNSCAHGEASAKSVLNHSREISN